ncbi:MAG: hypothetical protein Q9N67_11975 [Ghiorsea sp.]|nr:hypothetical protein [Ghiorsea sp.]
MVEKENGKFKFSSEYSIVVWVLGEPDMIYANEAGEDVSLIDNLRRKARIDFHFSPSAETP